MKYTLKDSQLFGYDESQQSLYDHRIANEGHEPISEADALAILNPPKALQELAAVAMAQVNAEYTKRMGAIADDYPLHERESWPVQLQEARELQTNPDAVTPWIDLCAAQRGLTREEFAGRIVTKDLAYRGVSGFLTGVRQKHEDEIGALLEAGEASREALQDYHWAEYWDELTQQERE